MEREKLAEYIFEFLPVLHRKMLCRHRPYKIPRQQMTLLKSILHNDGMPMKHYGHRMSISKPNMTKVVNHLIEEGYVTRGTDPDDRRIITLHITDEGKKTVEAFYDSFKSEIIESTQALSDEDMDALIDSFKTIQSILSKLDDPKRG